MVGSSPGKRHRYWLTDGDGLKPDEHADVMRTQVEQYGSDKQATSIAQVLRLPGFYHQKDPARRHLVRVIATAGWLPGFDPQRPPAKRYTPDQIVTAFKYVPKPETAAAPPEPGGFDRARLFQLLGFIPADDRDVWRSFDGRSAHPVTAGTIVHLARQYGWLPAKPDAPFEEVPPGAGTESESVIGCSDQARAVGRAKSPKTRRSSLSGCFRETESPCSSRQVVAASLRWRNS